ncbi:RNA-dependent RNA polymerase [Yongjia Tick Virus 1]|uniref:RNA-directed RNA polymerase L n=1 Tax=Yongjia Tick Virus 1 TaxID=1608145 RepID=A0A0B5KFD0_9VIRU|nr:RNA-dependent RNA polymerase [Yongjia Tick Virus 1]AJG39274.1 RNA-dependent RNA polymerase [Yongjia Tick Virus 1]
MSLAPPLNDICSRVKPDHPFNVPPSRLYSSSRLPGLPQYNARRSGGQMSISFQPQELTSASTTGSSIAGSYSLLIPESQTFIHDFTYGVWTSATNQKLRDHFPVLMDGDDLLTPDYVSALSPTEKVVVEFSTVRHIQISSLETSYKKKSNKYTRALSARATSECSVTFFVAVTCSEHVLTNMVLTQQEVDELCFRHRVAMDIAATLTAEGLTFDGFGEESQAAREAKILFESMELDWSKVEGMFPQITKEMYDAWREEPDLEYIRNLMTTVMEDSTKVIRDDTKMCEVEYQDLLHEKLAKVKVMIEEFRKGVDSEAKRDETRHKSTIPFPPWVPLVLPKSDGSLRKIHDLPGFRAGSTSEGRLWSDVLYSVGTGEVEIQNENKTLEYMESLELLVVEPEEKKERRKKYRRVEIKLAPEDAVDLAKKGFQGKAHRNNSQVKEARELSKQTFKLSTNTNDIEHFIHADTDVFDVCNSQVLPEEMREAFKNIELGHALHGVAEDQNQWTQKSRAFYQTPLGIWLAMVNSIAVELAASVRQNCKPNQVIIKKLRMFDVFLIVKPTNSSSHVFYTLAIQESSLHCLLSTSPVFKKFDKAGSWYFTDMHSVKIAKLSNMTRALSSVHNLYWFFRDFNEVSFFQTHSYAESQGLAEAERMTKVAMLVFFEDKARTEEIITNSRYLFMEGFVGPPATPKPEKMLKKYPSFCRTKLQVWLMKRSFLSMLKIISAPFACTSHHGRAQWTNMFNMFTDAPVASPKRLISLFYLGYLKNKEEGPDRNGNSKLYEKIIEEEDKHPGRREYLGLKDPPIGDVRPHEYSPSLIKVMARTGIAILERDYGKNIHERIKDEICTAISSISLDDIASLKASSNFGPDMYKTTHEKPYRRRKVATALSPMIKDGRTHLHHVITECLEKVEDKGGIHTCLFKKQQHGGIREIYVLGIEERIVQLAYETITKQICKFFKSETLMNPKQKHIIPTSHGYIATKICGGIMFTVCSSDDQSRWNQTQHVSKFAAMAIQLLPVEYHAFIIRASALFMRKRIMIDPALLTIMRTTTNLETGSEIFSRMHSAYHGNSEEKWLKAGEAFITTETGMMQGILHYTSSLMHTLFLEYYRDYSLKRMQTECLLPGTKAHMDILQSSDDSSVLISFPYTDVHYGLRCRYFSLILFEFKKRLGRYIGIEASPKSTSGTPYVVEFNSEFFFHNNHFRPEIRWIAAADLVCEHETLASRQEEMSNNLTSVLEGGSSLSLVAFCQIGQAMLHYLLLGMTTTGLFIDYCRSLRWSCDPSLGFFLMDHPFAAGAAGFKYNLWVACKFSKLGVKYASLLRLVEDAELAVEKEDRPTKFASLDTTRTGTFTGSIGIRWGDRKKWVEELEKMDLPEDYLEITDKSPSILYERASTSEQVKIKIAEKMHSPGVTESLSSGNSVSRVIASSVYCLSQQVMTNSSEWLDTRNDDPEKHSLFYYVKNSTSQLDTSAPSLSNEQERLLFPLSDEYSRIDSNLRGLSSIDGNRILEPRPTIQTRISIVETVKFLRCTPVELVSDVWFGTTRVNMSMQALQEEWEQLQQVLPWLDRCAEKTLKKSPFKHHCQLRNFLARMSPRGRMIHIVGAPIKRASGMSNLMTAIRDNFFPGFILTDSFDAYSKDRADRATVLKHYVYMALTSPLKDEEIRKALLEIFTKCPDIGYAYSMKKSKLTSLAIIQDWIKNGDDKLAVRRIENSGSGVVGGYSHKQDSRLVGTEVVYFGDGEWSGTVEGTKMVISLGMGRESGKTALHSITINKEMEAGSITRFLRQWAYDHHVLNDEYGWMTNPPDNKGLKVLFWMHKFKLTTKWVKGSIPIHIEAKVSHRREALPLSSHLRLTVRNRTINLVGHDGRSFPSLLSYTATDAEASTAVAARIREELAALRNPSDAEMEFLRREPSRSWFSMDRLTVKTIDSLVERIYRPMQREENVRLDRVKTQDLIKELTGNALRRRGVGMSDYGAIARLPDVEPVPENGAAEPEEESLDDLMNQIMLYDDEVVNGPPIVKWEDIMEDPYKAAEYEMADPLNADDFHLIAFGSAQVRQDYSVRFYEHPLVDAEVDRMIQQFPTDEISVYLRDRVARSCRIQEVEKLNKLLSLSDAGVIYVDEEPGGGLDVEDVEELG